MMKKLLLISFLLGLHFTSFGQTIDKQWNIGLHGGLMQYSGDIGKGFYKMDQAQYGFGGVSVSKYISGHFDLSLLVTKGEVGHKGRFADTVHTFHASLNTATLNFRFNILGPETFFRPYLFVGGGIIAVDKNYSVDPKTSTDFAIPSFGAGLNVKLGESLMLNVQETFLLSDDDYVDRAKANDNNDMFVMHTVGLTFNFGNKKDADGDGVPDRKDKCPDTPKDTAVDSKGCPSDRDKDGVYDYQDDCPDMAGLREFKGCPDKDGDGITDKDDRCPDVKGTADLKGCPDTDADGVVDIDDRCPDTKGSAELKGCPDKDADGIADIDDKCPDTKAGYKVDATGCTMDNDKDGIVNEEDLCPDVAGIASLKGCNDTDGDGVADNEDRCPEIKGTINNKGCPEMAKEDIKRITQIASKIFFEFNSDKLKVESLVQLDDLTEILNKYAGANLTIEGHTDNVGDDAYNMTLSQKRTESVKKYLASKGIEESRLTATGFGESKPIADNKTSIGRAKNRRVELKTSY